MVAFTPLSLSISCHSFQVLFSLQLFYLNSAVETFSTVYVITEKSD